MIEFFNSKEEAYKYLMQMTLTEKQLDSAKRSIKRATKSSQISITKKLATIIISIRREGQDGYQEMKFIIDDRVEKITVQKAYNAKEELVHYDPKSLPVSVREAKQAIATMQLTSAQRYVILNLLDKVNDDTRLEINKMQENVILKINEKTINIDCQGQEKIL